MAEDKMAYTAGLLDGEGYYGIVKSPRGSSVIFRPVISVGMNHPPTIKWLKEEFGGSVSVRAATEKHEECHLWSLRERQRLLTFLPSVARFAKIKRVHALFLLDFIQVFPYCCSPLRNLGPDLERITKYYEVMKALNSRGPGSSEMKEELSKVLTLVN